MGLNHLNKILLKSNETLVKNIPECKKDLDIILNEFVEILDNLIYEDKKENNNRFPLYSKNVKVNSVITIMQNLYKSKHSQKKETKIKEFYRILAGLDDIEFSIKNIRKSAKKVIRAIDKK